MNKLLITGGLGYIGSHCVVKLIEKGYTPIIVDNLINTDIKIKYKIEKLTNTQLEYYNVDISNKVAFLNLMEKICNKYYIDCIFHFAALKYLNESIKYPIKYYRNNINGILNILDSMNIYNIKNLIFSSSATVYSTNNLILPIKEDSNIGNNLTCPYGRTKYFTEEILNDFFKVEKDKSIILLRYFNPTGAHYSGFIGDFPPKYTENLFPCLQDAIYNNREFIINGHQYPTNDGTPNRDLIHIDDLVEGHISAYNYINNNNHIFETVNLGTGKPVSVLEVILKMKEVSGIDIKYRLGERREGDLASTYADVEKAKKILNWSAKKNLDDICKDSWNWLKYGYKKNTAFSKVPLRVSLVGGSSDLPVYCNQFGGKVLGFTIDKHVTCFMSVGKNSEIICNNEYYKKYIQQILSYKDLNNVYVKITTDFNLPSGLGSSSALVLSILDCIYQIKNENKTIDEWAKESYYIERTLLNIPGGKQENFICAYQQLGIYHFDTNNNCFLEKINISSTFWNNFISKTTLTYIKGPEKTYKYLSDKNINIDNIHKQKTFTEKMKNAILNENILDIKNILRKSWDMKKKLSNKISNEIVDKKCKELEKNNKAFKLCGSGGSGYMFIIE
jgi:UDP-glucose 4-epimerase